MENLNTEETNILIEKTAEQKTPATDNAVKTINLIKEQSILKHHKRNLTRLIMWGLVILLALIFGGWNSINSFINVIGQYNKDNSGWADFVITLKLIFGPLIETAFFIFIISYSTAKVIRYSNLYREYLRITFDERQLKRQEKEAAKAEKKAKKDATKAAKLEAQEKAMAEKEAKLNKTIAEEKAVETEATTTVVEEENEPVVEETNNEEVVVENKETDSEQN